MKTVLSYKTDDTIICYFPNAQIEIDDAGAIHFQKKPQQMSDTCWYEGPMLFASMALRNFKHDPTLLHFEEYYKTTKPLFLLTNCFENFIRDLTLNELKQLYICPNMLDLNLPTDFKERLSIAIHSPENKSLLLESLNVVIQQGKEQGLAFIQSKTNKILFDAGTKCLNNMGLAKSAKWASEINSQLAEKDQHNEFLTIQQKYSILDAIFPLLTITPCHQPLDPLQLYQMLEQKGPLLIKGKIGASFYKENSEKQLSAIDNLHIFGWAKQDYVEDKNQPFHPTIIIGVKYDAENKDQSRIYFLDTAQALNPTQQNKKIYSTSFAKFVSKIKNMYFLADYKLTDDIKLLEDKLCTNKITLKSGFLLNTNKPSTNKLTIKPGFFLNANDKEKSFAQEKTKPPSSLKHA